MRYTFLRVQRRNVCTDANLKPALESDPNMIRLLFPNEATFRPATPINADGQAALNSYIIIRQWAHLPCNKVKIIAGEI